MWVQATVFRNMGKLVQAGRWHSVDDAAGIFVVRPATIRTWLNDGYMKGEKRLYGQGRRRRWMIRGVEINRVLRLQGPAED